MKSRWMLVAVGAAAAVAAVAVVVHQWPPSVPATPRTFIVLVDETFDVEVLRRDLATVKVRVDALKILRANVHVVTVSAMGSDAEVADRLARVPGVRTVEADSEVRPQR